MNYKDLTFKNCAKIAVAQAEELCQVKTFEVRTTPGNPRWFIAFFAYLAAIHLRFAAYNFKTLAGDDIILLGGSNQKNGFVSTFWPSFTDHAQGKWRPVLQVILSPLLDFFGGDFWKYQLLNEALLAVCGLLIAVLVTNLTGGKFLLGISAGSFIIFARFNLYHILQVFGLMESMAIIFMLFSLIALEKYARLRIAKFLYFANFFFFLAIHTHERFLFLVPLVIFCTFIYSAGERLIKRVLLMVLPILIVVENYLVKTQVFHMTFLTGGGLTEMNSTTMDTSTFSWRALLNVFGYNSGPDYLSGRNAHLLGDTAVYLALVWSIPVLALVSFAWIKTFRVAGAREGLTKSFVAVLLIAPLVLSASITFRQEYRWLLAPYIALIIIAHVSVAILATSRRAQMVLCALLVVTGSMVGLYYSRYAESTYFFSTQYLGDSINDRIFVQYRDQISSTTFVIIDYDASVFDWAVGDQFYFQEYSPNPDFDIRTINSFEQIAALTNLRKNLIVFDYRGDQVVQMTSY